MWHFLFAQRGAGIVILFANFADCGILRDSSAYSNEFDNLYKLSNFNFDYTKPLIKDACKLPAKWVKFVVRYNATVEYVELLRKYNYSIEEILERSPYCWHTTSVPIELIPNKEAGMKYMSNYFYRDYYNMLTELSDEAKRQFPTFPKDLKKYHDLIIPIFNREQVYRREKQLAEKQERYAANVYDKAVKYNYSDNDYSIKACEKLVELLLEGTTLHHCVGSYVDSVSEGKEYILFLRKVSEPDTPYFTVDVTPNGHVRQIHGLHNCNIDENVKPFIKAWAKKFKLDISNCSGVYCALR